MCYTLAAMQKRDYQKELDAILQEISRQALTESSDSSSGKKPSLLLHACCAPCSSYVLEYLSSIFDITIYYYNPNIHPQAEYQRRLQELEKFLASFPLAVQNQVQLVIADYNPADYFTATRVQQEPELQAEPEKGERCRRCYEFRMKKAYSYACSHNFDWFTTTLSISPHKDADKINAIGETLQKLSSAESAAAGSTADTAATGTADGSTTTTTTAGTAPARPANATFTRFLPANFKKRGGFLRSTQLSAEYGLWRQDYCGCVYSQRQSQESAAQEQTVQ